MPLDWRLWIECRKWKRLPLAGGILDQPAILMRRFDCYEKAWASKQAIDEYLSGGEA